jgi:glucosamine kinase
MPLDTTNTDTLYLGIDGGGSKCQATIADTDGQVLGTGLAGPANPFQDAQQAKESIIASTELALVEAGLTAAEMPRLIAGIGLAGVNLPKFYNVMDIWQHPFKKVFLATDLHIACMGAHSGGDGAVMVVGTGSCGYSYLNGKGSICGAHGFPLGDKGSGAWIGLEAVKAALLAADGIGPATTLEQEIYQLLETDSLGIVEHLAGAVSSRYATIAPLVFAAAAQGDPVATGILREGAHYLNQVAAKLCATSAPRVSLLGGLGKYILPWLDQELVAQLSPPMHGPDYGAILFARTSWHGHASESTLEEAL